LIITIEYNMDNKNDKEIKVTMSKTQVLAKNRALSADWTFEILQDLQTNQANPKECYE